MRRSKLRASQRRQASSPRAGPRFALAPLLAKGFLSVSPIADFDMVNLKHTFLAIAGLILVSCVPPKAAVVAGPPVSTKKQEKTPDSAAAETPLPAMPDDGLRMPSNMLELPGEGEFRSTNPAATKAAPDAGAVISRPPTDPPSRPKPKEESNEDQR